MGFGRDLNLEATELSLGLPGTTGTTSQDHGTSPKSNKRSLPDMNEESTESRDEKCINVLNRDKKGLQETPPPSKAQVVGWPPIRSYRKNCLQAKKTEDEAAEMFVKVSLDGAPFLRKIDLKVYKAYPDLLRALEEMFKFRVGEYSEREGYNGSDYALTYEDKDGDWMLVGDIPWHMFINSCKRLRIVKGSEAGSLGCAL